MKPFLKYLPAALLILLFVYAAAGKLCSFAEFRIQLYRQPFPHGLADILLYAIPAAEMTAVVLILFDRTALKGFFLSLLLLAAFTIYISLVLLRFRAHLPCSCGGILDHMSWKTHLFFNLFFIAVNLIAISIHQKERRLPALK